MQRRAIDDDLYFEILASERLRVRALMMLMGALFTFSLILLTLPRDTLPFFPMVERWVPIGAVAAFYGAAFLYEIVAHTVLGIVITKRRHFPEGPRSCTSPRPFVKPKLTLAKLALPSGDKTLGFSGKTAVPTSPAIDPATNGAASCSRRATARRSSTSPSRAAPMGPFIRRRGATRTSSVSPASRRSRSRPAPRPQVR